MAPVQPRDPAAEEISRIAPPPRSTMRGTAARARWYTAWTIHVHARNRRPGEMVHGVDVDVEGPVPGAGVYFEQAAIRRAARTVDQHIQLSEGCHRLLHAAGCFVGVRYISRDGESPAIQGFHLPFHTLREQVVGRETAHRDIGAAKSKLARRSRTDAAAPTGYQANLSFQFHFVPVAALTFVIGWRCEPRETDPRAPAPPDSPPTPRAGRRNTPGRRMSTSTSHRSGEIGRAHV